MSYKHRPDGRIAVTIDSNVWNLLHELGLELATELRATRFALFAPREVEIELDAISDRPDKAALMEYIRRQFQEAGVRATAVFGFARSDSGPERRGGFGSGNFQSVEARAFYAAIRDQYLVGKPLRGSRLNHNEADAALGAASLTSVVLTLDAKKAGPPRIARIQGGRVLDMGDFQASGLSLAAFIEQFYADPDRP